MMRTFPSCLLVAVLLAAPAHALVYKPEKVGAQWDTWMFHDNGTYYLYYLVTDRSPGEGFCLATSKDGVHWDEKGVIFPIAKDAAWLGTGSVWKSPQFDQDKTFLCNFSEWRGPRQTIFLAQSSDLVHWTRLAPEYEFKQDPRWYKENGRWDCIYTIPRPGGGLYGYWTADPKQGPGVGFGQSLDGRKWAALPPPQFEKGCPHGECGAVEKIGDRYFMMLGTWPGMVTLVAAKPEGPFHPAKENFHLLRGDTYFARFFPTPDGLLVTHHSITHEKLKTGRPICYTAPLKRAVVDDAGTLRLGWWEGNEKLKGQAVAMPRSEAGTAGRGIAMLARKFDIGRGTVLEGTILLPQPSASDKPGIYLEYAAGQGKAILVAPSGVTQIGPIRGDGTGFQRQDEIDRQRRFGPRSVQFRLLLRHSLVEFYLDDVLIQCLSLPRWATGRIGLLRPAQIRDLKAWTMTLSDVPEPKRPEKVVSGRCQASSAYEGDYGPERAFDGDSHTRWSSGLPYGGPEWLQADLGTVKPISRMKLVWEIAFARGYRIQVSDDTATWTTVYRTDKGRGGTEIVDFPSTRGRYVRIACDERGTEHGFSLWEVEITEQSK